MRVCLLGQAYPQPGGSHFVSKHHIPVGQIDSRSVRLKFVACEGLRALMAAAPVRTVEAARSGPQYSGSAMDTAEAFDSHAALLEVGQGWGAISIPRGSLSGIRMGLERGDVGGIRVGRAILSRQAFARFRVRSGDCDLTLTRFFGPLNLRE